MAQIGPSYWDINRRHMDVFGIYDYAKSINVGESSPDLSELMRAPTKFH